jgi:hypothetical protein
VTLSAYNWIGIPFYPKSLKNNSVNCFRNSILSTWEKFKKIYLKEFILKQIIKVEFPTYTAISQLWLYEYMFQMWRIDPYVLCIRSFNHIWNMYSYNRIWEIGVFYYPQPCLNLEFDLCVKNVTFSVDSIKN